MHSTVTNLFLPRLLSVRQFKNNNTSSLKKLEIMKVSLNTESIKQKEIVKTSIFLTVGLIYLLFKIVSL